MCGIVGFAGYRPAANILIQGLRSLEYRGYDSTGIALLVDHHIQVKKSEGRIENTERLLANDTEGSQKSTCGIGHTRWATHGKPSTANAHPHKIGHIVLVHNGIIENDRDIRAKTLAKGHRPLSDTDSELIGFLLFDEMERGHSLEEACRRVSRELEGQWSIVMMTEREPGKVVGVRSGSPLVASIDSEGNVMVASDAQPLLPFTQSVVFLEPGEMVVGTPGKLQFFDLVTGQELDRQPTRLNWTPDRSEKNGFQHYMLKEICEQPKVFTRTLEECLQNDPRNPFQWSDPKTLEGLSKAEEIVLVACGTSWHAGLLGKYWIEKFARVPVQVEFASEYRYRDTTPRPGSLVIGISQSGETADTLVVIRDMKKKGIATLGITNVFRSSLSREAQAVIYTHAGPEIGVAATKTFMSQILTLFLFAATLARQRALMPIELLSELESNLRQIPAYLSDLLNTSALAEKLHDAPLVQSFSKIVTQFQEVRGFFFIGRGYGYPLALEGALKLKEVSYDHAEGHAAGELKHGPIALLDPSIVVIGLTPQDSWYSKNRSSLEEVKARGAQILGIGSKEDDSARYICNHWLSLPSAAKSLQPELLPFLLTPYLQLLGYTRGIQLNRDVDKPRNLAKSVTVE